MFTDLEGNITSVNMAMLRLTEHDNLVGQSINILMPPEIVEHHGEYMTRYLKSKIGNVIGNGGRAVPLITKSGKRKIVLKSVGEVRGGFIASLQDLTPTMRLQEEETRTAVAVRAVEERSQFLSFLNHELRVPMNALSLAIALLNQKRDSNTCVEAYDQHLKDMRSCCDQIVHLLNDVLDIERMRADVYNYEYGPADMTQLVTKATNISLLAWSARWSRCGATTHSFEQRVVPSHRWDKADTRNANETRLVVQFQLCCLAQRVNFFPLLRSHDSQHSTCHAPCFFLCLSNKKGK